MKRLIAQMYVIYRPHRWIMLGVLGFIAVSQFLNLISPFIHGKIIDSLVASKPLRESYTWVSYAFAIALTRIGVIAHFRERYELKHLDFAIPRATHRVTMSKLLGLSIGQHVNENSGIKQSVISTGQSSMMQLVATMLYQVMPMVVEVIALTCALLYFSPILGLIVLTGVCGYVAVGIRMNIHFGADFQKIETTLHDTSKFRGEIIRNIEVVLSNAQEKRAEKEHDEVIGKAHDFTRGVWLRFNNFVLGRNLIIPFLNITVLGTGIYLVSIGKHSVGELAMILSWSSSALNQIGSVGQMHRQVMQMYSSVKKYFDMLDIEPDVKVLPNPVRPERFQGSIEFKNVTLRYKRRDGKDLEKTEDALGTHAALQNASFSIKPGETVALVGESGAGKSTTINALLRSQDPQEGQILVDGHDLRILDLKRFREAIGKVEQEVSLFDNTLRYNITYGLNGRGALITDEALHRVAEMSCIDRFYSRLENGYDTVIGERGIKLSGGEKQRVGIARALIKNPDILIFDEATSSLDSENEALIHEAIEKVSHGRTTIIIAHRFSTIRKVDKVIVFDKGRVVGQGAHSELAHNCEAYQRLIRNQRF